MSTTPFWLDRAGTIALSDITDDQLLETSRLARQTVKLATDLTALNTSITGETLDDDEGFPPEIDAIVAEVKRRGLKEAGIQEINMSEIHDELCKPFPAEVVELKPGATTKDKTKALGLAYVDKRLYDARLDAVAGPENWHDHYEPWGGDRVFCHLTINGITKCDVGECEPKDPNAATIAVAQAFKRACSRFGLGRYLYSLEGEWLDYDEQKKRFSGNTTIAVTRMYHKAGLLNSKPVPVAAESSVSAQPKLDRVAFIAEIAAMLKTEGFTDTQLEGAKGIKAKLNAMSDSEFMAKLAEVRARHEVATDAAETYARRAS